VASERAENDSSNEVGAVSINPSIRI
jgi:hypothetical protein